MNPLLTYVRWLMRQEGPVLFLGVVGAAVVVLKPKNRSRCLWRCGRLGSLPRIR